MSSQNLLPTPLEIGNAFVRDRALIHLVCSTLQVALIGLVMRVLLAGFAILMIVFNG